MFSFNNNHSPSTLASTSIFAPVSDKTVITDRLKKVIELIWNRAYNAISNTPLFLWIYLLGVGYFLRKAHPSFSIGPQWRKINNKRVFLTSAEATIADGVIDVSKIDTTFNSIGGLESVKQTLREHIVWPFTQPELFSGKTVRSHPKGVLLYGPPGTGKTMLARALAKELNCCFINVNLESIFSKWVGETESNTAAIFTLAKKLSPTVIFIDEIDSLLSCRTTLETGPTAHTKSIFMTHWDGLEQNTDAKIIVVGATNRPMTIDEAIRRRLPLQIEVPLPDLNTRKEILQVILEYDLAENQRREEIINEIAKRTERYTGSDLLELCKAAALLPLREMHIVDGKLQGEAPKVNLDHFFTAMTRIKPSS